MRDGAVWNVSPALEQSFDGCSTLPVVTEKKKKTNAKRHIRLFLLLLVSITLEHVRESY